ncbi:MAG TPA: hypothetical protein VK508_09600 [Cyclobacteriaceae bacterium]|nr:hypothetical protein [Cyclobacteriaceae bacterium]
MMTFLHRYFIHILLIAGSFFVAKYIINVGRPAVEQFTFSLEGQSSSSRVMQFFYAVRDNAFSEETSIAQVLQGSKHPQKVSYSLPASLDITSFRLDFGNSPSNSTGTDTIVMKQVTIENGFTTVSFEMKDLVNNFTRSASITSFSEDGTMVTQVAGGVYDPYIFSNDISPILAQLRVADTPVYLVTCWIIYVTLAIAIFVSIPPLEVPLPILLFVSSFALILIIPTFITLSSPAQTTNAEKRQLSQVPDFSFSKQYAHDFETYFTDHFGLRSQLIEAGSWLKVSLFDVAVNPEKAMVGKQGWMYYNNADGSDEIFGSYTHTNLLLQQDLEFYVNSQLAHKKECEEKGIKYFFGFCPQTQTIYPEYMPYAMKIQIRDTMSRGDQIMAALKQSSSNFNFIDLRPSMFEAKSQVQLYRKLDSHWNNYGAYIGYKSLFDQMFPEVGVKPLHLSDFDITWSLSDYGDLALMTGASAFPDSIPSFILKQDTLQFAQVSSEGFPERTVITHCETCPEQRTLLMFRDSYTEALIQYISRHFRRVIYVWGPYDQNTVNLAKPDIVLHLPVERYL